MDRIHIYLVLQMVNLQRVARITLLRPAHAVKLICIGQVKPILFSEYYKWAKLLCRGGGYIPRTIIHNWAVASRNDGMPRPKLARQP
jgi:hypothetical protein